MEKIVSYFIPTEKFEEVELFRRYKLIINTLIVTIFFGLNYSVLSYIIGLKEGVITMLASVIWYAVLLFMLKKHVPHLIISNLYILGGVISINICIYFSKGFDSPVLPWLATSPIVALLLAGKKSGIAWVIINTLCVLVFGILNRYNFNFPSNYNPDWGNVYYTNCYVGLVLVIFILSLVFENGKNSALNKLITNNELLAAEQQKSENLLLNILPAEVSFELKETGKTKAHSFSMATVMFADFVAFTKVAEKLSPEDLVLTIDEYFEAFDNIIEKHGIEKIKTVGDAYICAAGLPVATTNNALVMINVAQNFINALNNLKVKRLAEGKEVFDIRIGIHTGALVAGVVGIKKFAYDIWGDTVNTAARMQEESHPNRINISGSTHQLIQNNFDCEYRGKVQAKNKGQIDMYFVNDSKSA